MLNLKKIPRNHNRKIKNILVSHKWEFYTRHNNYKGGDVGPIEDIDLVMYDICHGHAHIFQDLNSDKFVVQYAGPCQWISKEKVWLEGVRPPQLKNKGGIQKWKQL